MLRIAIIVKEKLAKDIIFTMQGILDEEFTFVHYEKISTFIKERKVDQYDVIFLDEGFNNIRVSSALNYQKNHIIIIYCGEESKKSLYSAYTRIFYINKYKYKEELYLIKERLEERLIRHKQYLFTYNGVSIKLKYYDIYYIEKEEKNLVYHTRKGIFYERGSVAKKSEELLGNDFIRINSGIIVNYEYIFKIDNHELEMNDHTKLPISRSRQLIVKEFIKKKANKL